MLLCDLLSLHDARLRKLDEARGVATFEPAQCDPARLGHEFLKKHSQSKLIRDATVADLHVIRREWACYLLGEIANIRNVMASETFSLTQTQLAEHEVVATTDAERQEVTEQEDSSKLASELTQEVNTQITLSVNGYFDASVQYKAPVATVNIGGGADVSLYLHAAEIRQQSGARGGHTRSATSRHSHPRDSH